MFSSGNKVFVSFSIIICRFDYFGILFVDINYLHPGLCSSSKGQLGVRVFKSVPNCEHIYQEILSRGLSFLGVFLPRSATNSKVKGLILHLESA